MIDLVTPKSLKKGSRKKSKLIEEEDIIEEKFANVVKLTPKRRRKQDSGSLQEPQSTFPDENFMLPSDIEFVKIDKSLEVDEITIPSDIDDPNNSQPLSNLVACRSTPSVPETSLKCVWSHKRKVLTKNRDMCKCYSELERRTLEHITSIKILKSKRKFVQHFTDFERYASDIQCKYPYCKRVESIPSTSTKHKVSTRIVKKSKRHKVCQKTRTAILVTGSKRDRDQPELKTVKYSKYFINEVVRLMLENRTVWTLDILTKLIKTKQLKSSTVRDLTLHLIKIRDTPTIQLLLTHAKTCTESHVVAMLAEVLLHPVYSVSSNVDGQEKQDLDLILSLILSLPFESSAMKRALKPITPHHAQVLVSLINDRLLNNVPLISSTAINLTQVLNWCDVLVEVYFSVFVREPQLIRKIHNNINLHLQSCRTLFSLNEYLFRIKHSKKFKK